MSVGLEDDHIDCEHCHRAYYIENSDAVDSARFCLAECEDDYHYERHADEGDPYSDDDSDDWEADAW
jgi:hypothetical protein